MFKHTCGFHRAECGFNWFHHPDWDLTYQENDLAESRLGLTSAE
jgi:pterin-4a-carbinolamine dehydratase